MIAELRARCEKCPLLADARPDVPGKLRAAGAVVAQTDRPRHVQKPPRPVGLFAVGRIRKDQKQKLAECNLHSLIQDSLNSGISDLKIPDIMLSDAKNYLSNSKRLNDVINKLS